MGLPMRRVIVINRDYDGQVLVCARADAVDDEIYDACRAEGIEPRSIGRDETLCDCLYPGRVHIVVSK